MKKLICAAFLAAFTLPAFAQQEQGVRIGLTANPVLGWFKTQKADEALKGVNNDGLKIGFSYGAMGEYQFADNYALEIRIHHLIYQGGYKVNYKDKADFVRNSSNDYEIGSRNWDLQYLNLPVNLKLKTNEIGYFTFFGKFGLAPAFRLQSRANEKRLSYNTLSGVSSDKENDIGVDSKLMNVTVNFGLGAMYHLGGDTYLNGGITFHNGLVEADQSNNYGVKPAYLSLDLGILF